MARVIRSCRDLPGQKLFEYVDESGAVQTIDSADVNTYLKEIAGIEVSAKDFRTWAGTVHVASRLARREGRVRLSQVAALRLLAPLSRRRRGAYPRRSSPPTSRRAASRPS